MSAGIARDLSAKLQLDLAAVLERNGNIARHVLDQRDLAIILLEAAVMMVRTSAATIANMAADDAMVTEIFDGTLAAIIQQIQASRADGLERIMAARREQRP